MCRPGLGLVVCRRESHQPGLSLGPPLRFHDRHASSVKLHRPTVLWLCMPVVEIRAKFSSDLCSAVLSCPLHPRPRPSRTHRHFVPPESRHLAVCRRLRDPYVWLPQMKLALPASAASTLLGPFRHFPQPPLCRWHIRPASLRARISSCFRNVPSVLRCRLPGTASKSSGSTSARALRAREATSQVGRRPRLRT